MDKHNTQLDAELSSKLIRALTANSEALFQIILDLHSDVVLNALKNPHFSEDHLLALLKRRDLTEETLERIYRNCSKNLNHRLILALIKNPATPDMIVRTLLPRLHLFELVDICFLPGATSDKRMNAERNILQRLPTAPLGNKITLARRATANIVAELLKEGDPLLIKVCLDNPRLKEAAIYRFLNGPRASAETISMIARHHRWQHRPNLRMAILRNSRTPAIWFTVWLPKLSLPLIKNMLKGQRLKPEQKRLVALELRKRGINLH